MGSAGEKTRDFYKALGLKRDCSGAELRNAYKKLAMKWHPDRCSASGNAKFLEEAKEKFQSIQEAYSVLSDSNKRFMYDAGVYDSDDDENGFGDFLGEMAQMMNQQNKQNESGGHETLEELQQLFVDMFHDDLNGGYVGIASSYASNGCDLFSSAVSLGEPYCHSNKRGSSTMCSGTSSVGDFHSVSGGFCFGSNDSTPSMGDQGGSKSKRRNGRK